MSKVINLQTPHKVDLKNLDEQQIKFYKDSMNNLLNCWDTLTPEKQYQMFENVVGYSFSQLDTIVKLQAMLEEKFSG